ncbi:MAG: HAMP domain-containing histidine kinase, partial [Planctomycetales bacterium]|nr:HAMP domain-containing histidine kinase [Planctomycetales bacterium]
MEPNSKTLALDQTLGAVCHEIRTPLTALVGALNLLGEGSLGSLNPDQKGFVQVAIRNGRRMQALVTSILSSSRAARGGWPVDAVPANLARLSEAGIAEALEAAGGTRDQVWVEVAGGMPLVSADLEGITRIVKNLVANALRFSAPGGTVRIVIRSEPGTGVLEVTDGGPGIPAEDREWIFGRFHQVPHERGGRPRGGLGLGLFLSRTIAHAHGGEIACLSPAVGSPGPGPGTTFRVTLPLD